MKIIRLRQTELITSTRRSSREIFDCCVKQAVTGAHQNHKLKQNENKQVQDDKVTLTRHFITCLPNLLTKYIADANKLAYLLQIPTHFDLSQYTLGRQDELFKLLEEIVSKHNELNMIEDCDWSLEYLRDEDAASGIYAKCQLKFVCLLKFYFFFGLNISQVDLEREINSKVDLFT